MTNTATETRTGTLEHRVALVAWRTKEIREAEAAPEWDGDLLRALYSLRLSHVIEALEAGATPAYLSAITGNG
jgi:hypothetical protein